MGVGVGACVAVGVVLTGVGESQRSRSGVVWPHGKNHGHNGTVCNNIVINRNSPNTGAFRIRIGFRGPHFVYAKEPQDSIGNYSCPYVY